jgi:hypothetical protein
MQVTRAIAAIGAALLLLATDPVSADYSIANLIHDAGLRESSTAMRDVSPRDSLRVVLVRDLGFELPDFDGFNVVDVASHEEALARAGSAAAFIALLNVVDAGRGY